MFGNGATMEAFRESEMFWWVLLIILSQAFNKNSLGGCRGERFIDRSVVSSLDISANPITMEAFRELKIVMVVPVDDPRTSAVCNPYSFGNCEKTLNRNHHNPFDTLKASMVADFADIEAFKE